ncbi:hypothetical protein Pint_32560 [Pistacia integerrima]|uniref:Uncharacterized protein n=1 Tax=Pistacia integerrima TaxID=434235 RepID=A0ACC0XN26_9ROSI|nr:hypothetical protein Pint_32560 [Pistacia integerrima]
MLSLSVNSPIPNTLVPLKLNPSRPQTRLFSSVSLRKLQVKASSAEVAFKEEEKYSDEGVSPTRGLSEELPPGLSRKAMPKHVAVIMDGNARWARKRGLPSSEGHQAGVQSLRELIELCCKWGIKVLTVFAFSYDNWVRPKVEVDFLMSLEGIRISVIGDSSKLPTNLQKLIRDAEEATRENSNFQLIVAVSYSGKYDIIQACKGIAQKVKEGVVELDDIDETLVEQELETNCTDHPYPDLLIRTSGELRVSNFLLWQLAYTEFFFVQPLWPDFGKDEFVDALTAFQKRQRRYGGRDS